MRVIAVANQKGGTGKTTTTVNLGRALSSLGESVLLIDLDPQANLTYSFGINPTNGTISDVLQTKQTIQTILVKSGVLSIAPASEELADLGISLVNKIGREQKLKDSLVNLFGFDYVFIDTPPSLSILTLNALNAADEVIIPMQMEVLSLQGLTQLIATIKEVKDILNSKLEIKGIISSMYDVRRRLTKEIQDEISKNLKIKIFESSIRECVKIAEAPSFAQSVLDYAPFSNGASDFTCLAKEFLKERSTYATRN